MRSVLLLILIISTGHIHAQDLTGVWQGHFRSTNAAARNSPFDDRYKFEVQIAQTDKKIEAITYSYLSSIFYGKASATGTVSPKTNKTLLQELKLLEVRNQSGDVCIMTCFLQYAKSGDEEFLEGSYVSMNVRDSSNCGRGKVFLRKVPQSDFYKEPFLVKREKEINMELHRNPPTANPPVAKANPAPPVAKASSTPPVAKASSTPPVAKSGTPPVTRSGTHPPVVAATPKTSTQPSRRKEPEPAPLAKASIPTAPKARTGMDSATGIGRHFSVITPRVLQSRNTVLAKAIIVNTREVTLNIYDDGAIDHDTVSIYLDKKQVISHAMLTDRPLVLTLHLDDNDDYHELVMVAENEGEIPPNTSLMIVKAGDKEYEVRITSTEQKNALVTFRYQK